MEEIATDSTSIDCQVAVAKEEDVVKEIDNVEENGEATTNNTEPNGHQSKDNVDPTANNGDRPNDDVEPTSNTGNQLNGDDVQLASTASTVTKEMILQKGKEFVKERTVEDITMGQILRHLEADFGDAVKENKNYLKQELLDFMTDLTMMDEQVDGDSKDEQENSKESEEEEEEEDDASGSSVDYENLSDYYNSDDEVVKQEKAADEEWKSYYGRVMWTKTNKSFPWWPCFVYRPSRVKGRLQARALDTIGKRHIVYYYGTGDFDFPTLKQLKPYEENLEEFSKQKVTKSYEKSFKEALELIASEAKLPVYMRVKWNHKIVVKKPPRKSATRDVVIPTPVPASATPNVTPAKTPKAKKEKEVKPVEEEEDDEEEFDFDEKSDKEDYSDEVYLHITQ